LIDAKLIRVEMGDFNKGLSSFEELAKVPSEAYLPSFACYRDVLPRSARGSTSVRSPSRPTNLAYLTSFAHAFPHFTVRRSVLREH
jgi:hypothetical protein